MFAQDLVLTGRVLGPTGEPVGEQAVLLHRVAQGGGALLARGTTDALGRFTVRADDDGGSEGVYFVATRYEGELYIGPLRRPPFAADEEYIVQVGIPGVGDIRGLSAATNPPSANPEAASPPLASRSADTPAAPPGRAFGVALLLTAIGVGALLSIRSGGPSRRRRALIRVAELDERNAGDASAEQTRRRNALLRRATEQPR
jgi:hypothetical protein